MTVTLFIIIATCIVSVSAFQSAELKRKFLFTPYLIQNNKQWYRFISSGFIHADWMHLIVNMYVMYSFGNFTETYFNIVFENRGHYYFILLYFGGMVASVIPTYKKHLRDYSYNALGASGAVAAVVFSTLVFAPMQKLSLMFIPIALPGILFGFIYLVYCYWASKQGRDNINHDAHLWGSLFGFIFTIALKPSLFLMFLHQLPFMQHAY